MAPNSRNVARPRQGSLRRRRHRERVQRAYESGFIDGLRTALSCLGDRPGDISQTGAEGFIISVEQADEAQRDTTETTGEQA